MPLHVRSNICLGALGIALLSSCSGDDGSNGPAPRNPAQPGRQPTGLPLNEKNSGLHYNTDYVTDKNGDPVSISKMPSTLVDDKWIDACQKPQIPFLDHCFDEVFISDQAPGFKLVSKERTFESFEFINDEWKQTLNPFLMSSETEKVSQRITFQSSITPIVGFYPSILPTRTGVDIVDGRLHIRSLSLRTVFSFIEGNPVNAPHFWYIKGKIELNGNLIDLPATRWQIAQATGSTDGSSFKINNGTMTFGYNNWILRSLFGDEGYSENEMDQLLLFVDFDMDPIEDRIPGDEEEDDVQPDPN